MLHLARSALAVLLLIGSIGGAAALDNGSGSSTEDLRNACGAAYVACKAACQRPKNSASGQLAQGFCLDDCYAAWQACARSIPAKAGGKNTRPKKLHP